MSLVNSLTYLGEEIPSWKQVTHILQCINKSWEPIALHFQTQSHTKKFDIDEFFGKLSAFQRLQKRKEEPMNVKEKEKNLALKVERALKSTSRDFQEEDDEDCDDSELSFITKVMKKFWKKGQPERSIAPPNLAEVRCYNCQEMGHFASSCTKSKVDQGNYKDSRKENALVTTAWGESDSDKEIDDKRRIALVTSLDTEVRPPRQILSL